jgi:hypothetical protein
MDYGYEETKLEEKRVIEVQDSGCTEIFQVSSTDAVSNTPDASSLNDSDNDIEMKTNEPSVDTGVHFYGETVSQNIDTTNMLDFIADIFIQYQRGNLPKTTPEETSELLRKWFDGSILEDVQSEFYEQPVTPVESRTRQHVRNILKRPRVDSNL